MTISIDDHGWVTLDGGTGMRANLLGIPDAGLHRVPPAFVADSYLLAVTTRDQHGGSSTCCLTIGGTGTITAGDAPAPDVALEAPYASILDWLHGDTLLGHMLIDGATIRGDLFVFSAIEGIVSAPPGFLHPEIRQIIGELTSREEPLSSATTF